MYFTITEVKRRRNVSQKRRE